MDMDAILDADSPLDSIINVTLKAEAASKWYFIGLAIGFTPESLDDIKGESNEEKLEKILRKWMKEGKATIGKLCSVMKKKSVLCTNAANMLEQKYGDPGTLNLENDLKPISDIMLEAAPKWYYVGLGLKLKLEFLDSVEKSCDSDQEKLITVLKEWMKKGGVVIDSLCSTLRKDTVKQEKTADSLEKWRTDSYHKRMLTHSTSLKKQESAVHTFDIDKGQIKLGDIIGSGAAGTVRKATWTTESGVQDVAVKICLTGAIQVDISMLERIPRHPNVLTYFGFYTVEERTMLVTEFASSGSLYTYIHEKKIKPTPKQSLAWVKNIAYGMTHLHRCSIIHRDLKSLNILLTDENLTAKICDFGCARPLDQTAPQSSVCGTYRWMAPEIGSDVEAYINNKCDVYSFAMVLYELYEHKLPFHNLGIMAVVRAISNKERPVVTTPSFPTYVKELMEECWKESPSARPPFEEILARIERF